MPNHCSNCLRIKAPAKELREFLEACRAVWAARGPSGENFFEVWAPMPPEIRDGSGLEACRWGDRNWGTKWGAYHTAQSDLTLEGAHGDEVEVTHDIHFDTAWAPPCEAVQKLSQLHPKWELELAYSECGAAEAGSYSYVDGELIEEMKVSVAYVWAGLDDDVTYASEEKAMQAGVIDPEPRPSARYAAHLDKYGLHEGG